MTTATDVALGKNHAIPRSLWITLEAAEVIELKRIGMDRDGDGAVAFFRDVLVPRIRAACSRGLAIDLLVEKETNERLSG